MIVSREHGRLSSRLKRAWRKFLASESKEKKKSRPKPPGPAPLANVNMAFLGRVIAWGCALAPYPKSWILCVLFASLSTLYRASQLKGPGHEEALIEFYGASDSTILHLSRRRLRRQAAWSCLDALFVLGLWCLLGVIPSWMFFVGVPLYVIASAVGTRVLAYVIPTTILGLTVVLGYILLFVVIIVGFQGWFDWNLADTPALLLSCLTPSGWILLMMRAVLSGHSYILCLPLLLLAVSLARFRWIRDRQESQLLHFIGRNETLVFSGTDFYDAEEDDASEAVVPGNSRQYFQSQLASLKDRSLLHYPQEQPKELSWTHRALFMQIILVCAVLVRWGEPWLGTFRFFLFAGALAITALYLLPILGVPAWFSQVYLSGNRVASTFILFSVPFRKLLKESFKSDLQKVSKVLPLFFAFIAAAFWIAFPVSLTSSIAVSLLIVLMLALKLPLLWFHVTMYPLSSKPFRKGNVFRGFLMLCMMVLFLLEIGIAGFFIAFACENNVSYSAGFTCLGHGVLNAALGMLGVQLGLSAYEKLKIDVITTPKQNAL